MWGFDQFRCASGTDRQFNLPRNWTLSPFNEWLNGLNVQVYTRDFEGGKNEVLVGKHHHFGEILNSLTRSLLQGARGVRFCQLSTENLRGPKMSVPPVVNYGDISLSVLKSKKWPILKYCTCPIWCR